MQTERLVALQSFPYAGKSIKAGNTFLAEREDARILKLIGRAKDEPAPEPAQTCAAEPVKSPAPVVTAFDPKPVVAPPWQSGAKTVNKSKKSQE